MGLITAGIGVGGSIYPYLLHILFTKCGTKKTLQLLAIINLLLGLIIAWFVPPPRSMDVQRKAVSRRVLSSPCFGFMMLACFMINTSGGIPYAFAPQFADSLGFCATVPATMLALYNGLGIPGRLFWGTLRDYFGSQNTVGLSLMLTAAATVSLWYPAAGGLKAACWAFLAVHGFMNSSYAANVNTYIIDVFDQQSYYGVLAAVNVARGVGALVGSPIAGALLKDKDDGAAFRPVIALCVSMLCVAIAATGMVRVFHCKREGWQAIA